MSNFVSTIAIIIPILTFLFALYEGISYIFSLNAFDEIFLQKGKVKIYTSIRFLLSVLGIVFFVAILAIYLNSGFIITINATPVTTIARLVSILNGISFVLFFINAIVMRFEKDVKKTKWLNNSSQWLASINILSLLTLFIIFFLSIIEKSKTEGIGIFVAAFFVLYFLFLFYLNMIFSVIRIYKKANVAHYKMKVSTGQQLFILGLQDKNILILSEEGCYKESKKMFLYDMEKEKLTEFIPVDLNTIDN